MTKFINSKQRIATDLYSILTQRALHSLKGTLICLGSTIGGRGNVTMRLTVDSEGVSMRREGGVIVDQM